MRNLPSRTGLLVPLLVLLVCPSPGPALGPRPASLVLVQGTFRTPEQALVVAYRPEWSVALDPSLCRERAPGVLEAAADLLLGPSARSDLPASLTCLAGLGAAGHRFLVRVQGPEGGEADDWLERLGWRRSGDPGEGRQPDSRGRTWGGAWVQTGASARFAAGMGILRGDAEAFPMRLSGIGEEGFKVHRLGRVAFGTLASCRRFPSPGGAPPAFLPLDPGVLTTPPEWLQLSLHLEPRVGPGGLQLRLAFGRTGPRDTPAGRGAEIERVRLGWSGPPPAWIRRFPDRLAIAWTEDPASALGRMQAWIESVRDPVEGPG